jgi:hypothetical protein
MPKVCTYEMNMTLLTLSITCPSPHNPSTLKNKSMVHCFAYFIFHTVKHFNYSDIFFDKYKTELHCIILIYAVDKAASKYKTLFFVFR